MLWTLQVCLLLTGACISAQDMVNKDPRGLGLESASLISETNKPTIQALHITSDIKYRYAKTLVSSKVVNPSDEVGVAAFSITLPETAYISQFLMEFNGKVYNAYVRDAEEAKGLYNEAVESGQFEGHVEQSARDSKQFTVSIKVKARETVTFNLTYEQLLIRKMGVYSHFISISPQQIVEDMTVTVNIKEDKRITKLDVLQLQISSKAVQDSANKSTPAIIKEKSPHHKQVVWAPTAEHQNSQGFAKGLSQFVVKYDLDHATKPQEILVDECYFVHFFAPEHLSRLKKHVVFVLDYSGSMEGRKQEQLKQAMDTILSDLDPEDYFSIVSFSTNSKIWSPNKISLNTLGNSDYEFVVAATPGNISLAHNYFSQNSGGGSTNIISGLRVGLKLVNIGYELWRNESDPPQPVVIFLTDGLPNEEESDTSVIIEKITQLNNNTCPIYSLAFGYDADLNFLRKLSLSNKGSAKQIYEAQDASSQLQDFFKTVTSSLLSNITFSYLPGMVNESSNRNFPALFNGSELIVAGKLQNCIVKYKEKIGEVRGISAKGPQVFPSVVDLITPRSSRSASSHRSARSSQSTLIGQLERTWAYLTIQQLLEKVETLDENEEVTQTKTKALEVALQYSFVTPVTALIVEKPDGTKSVVSTTNIKPGAEIPEIVNIQQIEFTTQPGFIDENGEDGQSGHGCALACSTINLLFLAFFVLWRMFN